MNLPYIECKMADPTVSSTNANPEKYSQVAEHTVESNGYDGGSGDLQVLSNGDSGSLKTAKDGETVLLPQPSDSPDDPLNWSFV